MIYRYVKIQEEGEETTYEIYDDVWDELIENAVKVYRTAKKDFDKQYTFGDFLRYIGVNCDIEEEKQTSEYRI